MEKRGETRKFKWTPKRRVALECLIQARGNVSLAVELSKKHSPSVSYGYLQELKYAEKYKAFREEYNRRTGELLHAMEVDTEYVIQGYVELTGPDMPPSTRRQALRDLGQYLGLWAPKVKEVGVHEARDERLAKAIDDEPDPAKKRQLIEAAELISDAIS
ncbi:MAG: hypothetical protein MUP04_06620 [Anaerolineae bacterium]|nr:hypothetical protein [Anaerolineae bacterium]